MKTLIAKMILVSFVLSFAVVAHAAVTNVYESAGMIAELSIQPRPDDLAQLSGSTNLIVKGAMHTAIPGSFGYLFNSDAVGKYGPTDSIGLFQDGISPTNDVAIHCDFDSPKTIEEVHVYSFWGDQRSFTWFEVWVSTTGTNDPDYTEVGVATFGEIGQTNVSYQNCLARLYDPDDGIIANNVISLMLVQKNVGYGIAANVGVKEAPGTPQGAYVAIAGSAVGEIDIIGIPEPATLLSSGLLLGLAFWRRR